jgi:hypothetical protein
MELEQLRREKLNELMDKTRSAISFTEDETAYPLVLANVTAKYNELLALEE